jgi:hypothetical protein
MVRNVRLVLLMGIFFKPVCSILFFWCKILPKVGQIIVNKGNILPQYSLFWKKKKNCQIFEEKLKIFIVAFGFWV